jgi:hypothetical protein
MKEGQRQESKYRSEKLHNFYSSTDNIRMTKLMMRGEEHLTNIGEMTMLIKLLARKPEEFTWKIWA